MSRPVLFIVEDDTPTRQMYMSVLKDRFNLREFASGLEALDQVETGDWPDAYLIDYRMPSMDGLEFFERVRAAGAFRPAVLLSGATDKQMALRALELGVHAVLQKPADLMEIAAMMEKAVVEHQLVKLNEDLLREFHTYAESVGHLIRSYENRIRITEEQIEGKKVPGLREHIEVKECRKWKGRVTTSRETIDRMADEQKALRARTGTR